MFVCLTRGQVSPGPLDERNSMPVCPVTEGGFGGSACPSAADVDAELARLNLLSDEELAAVLRRSSHTDLIAWILRDRRTLPASMVVCKADMRLGFCHVSVCQTMSGIAGEVFSGLWHPFAGRIFRTPVNCACRLVVFFILRKLA